MSTHKYTRERAAQDLLEVAHRLSHKSYVFRSVDSGVKEEAIDGLDCIRGELLKLGYTVSTI